MGQIDYSSPQASESPPMVIDDDLFTQGIDEISLFILKKWNTESQNLVRLWNQNSPELPEKSQVLLTELTEKFGDRLSNLDSPLAIALAAGGNPWVRLSSGTFLFAYPYDIFRFEVLSGGTFLRKIIDHLRSSLQYIDLSVLIQTVGFLAYDMLIPVNKTELQILRALALPLILLARQFRRG